MLNYLDRLRKKPEPERRKTVFLISLGITLGIALLWGLILGMHVSTMDFSFPTDPGAAKNTPSLKDSLSTFGDQIAKIFSNASAAGTATTSTTTGAIYP